MIRQRDMSKVRKWGVCIVTFTGTPRATSMSGDWFNAAFSDPDGIAAYFREMSGGRKYIEWQVFGPTSLMTLPEKQALEPGGAEGVINGFNGKPGFRQAAVGLGIPVGTFDRFMWIIDDGISSAGVTSSDILLAASTFTPQETGHEVTHAFGVGYHADRYGPNDYGDPFCIMGRGNTARSFQNMRLTVAGPFTHATTGPGICAPYLLVAGWLDYAANVVEIPVAALDQHAGGAVITLDANQGAPPTGSGKRIALTVGSLPSGPADAQMWIEYRHPSRFDRRIDRDLISGVPDVSPFGVLLLHQVHFNFGVEIFNQLHSTIVHWSDASRGSTMNIGFGYRVRVADVDPSAPRVFLTLERVP
jgi:hypothetical protein